MLPSLSPKSDLRFPDRVDYSGSNMPNWLVWIYHINPANYAFAALMANEFGRVDL
jgi:hypothetical protein